LSNYFDLLLPVRVGIVLIFVPFNFAAWFGSWNKWHANIKGFTVPRVKKSPQPYVELH